MRADCGKRSDVKKNTVVVDIYIKAVINIMCFEEDDFVLCYKLE